MHETHLTNDLVHHLEQLVEEEGATRVSAIEVRLGALSHFDPGHFREHFEDSARGTTVEGARVDAEVDPDPTAPGAQGILLVSVELDLEEPS